MESTSQSPENDHKTTKIEQEQSKPAIAPGQMRVIKRNGSVVSYDAEKIAIAITKAFLAVEGGAEVEVGVVGVGVGVGVGVVSRGRVASK